MHERCSWNRLILPLNTASICQLVPLTPRLVALKTIEMQMPAHRNDELLALLLECLIGLPPELRVLGNSYAREEFKKHKTCNKAETAVFMVEWTKYVVMLAQQLGLKGPKEASYLGKDLNVNSLDDMREDQIVQLYELYAAARDLDTEDAHKDGNKDS
ncbi:hypothetical protein C0J52_15193 [Blattella germanica]|nr:hypothetical protein C0J52_15193 [Blattella germanica]